MTGNGVSDDLDYGQTIQIPRFGPSQKIFRRYTLQKILGRGGMGVVWLARDDQLETLVALKVLPDALCHDRASLNALKRETKLGLLLAHPNIVRIYDFQQDDNAAAISMEYVDGVTLSDVRCEKPEQVFSPSDLQPYIFALCDALNYAHTRRKIVHRDLKPRNLMLNSEGDLKIADFGISRSISESMIMVTGKLGSTGSPPYISPQQWDGDQPSPSDDIYSVGATLYELLTSKPPLLGVVDWQQVHSNVPPPMWKRRNDLGISGVPPIPEEWEKAIAGCLAKDPKNRPQTILELQSRLASSLIEDLTAEEVAEDDLFGDTTVIQPITRPEPKVETPVPPKVEVPTPPFVETRPEPKREVPPAPLVESKVDVPTSPLIEAKPKPAPEVLPALSGDTKLKAKPEVSPAPKAVPTAPLVDTKPKAEPEVLAAPLVEAKPAVPGPPLSEPTEEPIAAKTAEIDELPVEAETEVPVAPSITEKSASVLAQEPASLSPPAPPPAEELASTPDGKVFPEALTETVGRTEVTPRRMPRWIWPASAAAVLVLLASFLISRKPSPPARTATAVESPHVQITPSPSPIRFTMDIESAGESPDAKRAFPKHVHALVNRTAVSLKGDNNHWSFDFGANEPPLPFDLEISAPGYQSAVLHFEHMDDLKNPSPLQLEREHGSIAFRPSDSPDFKSAQLKMVEALPEEREDVVVNSSTLVHDLNGKPPVLVPTGVYEVSFQSGNGTSAAKPTARVAVKAGALQTVDIPKISPPVTARATPRPTISPVNATTTNETPPLLNKETPPPRIVVPSPAVPKPSPAIATAETPRLTSPPATVVTREISTPASNPPTPVATIARETPAPPAVPPTPAAAIAKETPVPANIPPRRLRPRHRSQLRRMARLLPLTPSRNRRRPKTHVRDPQRRRRFEQVERPPSRRSARQRRFRNRHAQRQPPVHRLRRPPAVRFEKRLRSPSKAECRGVKKMPIWQ